MRVGIYNEPAEGGIGGSEISAAVLAEALATNHQVDVVHHKPYMDRERLAEISGTDLSGVRMRFVVVEPYSFGRSRNPWRRYKEARDWQGTLSEPYDLFINFTHGFPPFCHARRGALVVLFPFNESPHSRHNEPDSPGNNAPFWNRITNVYHEWEWQKRLDSYQIKTAISRFSQIWTARRWGVECEIFYPPVDTRRRIREKENIILSVGRFTASGHSKKQLEMISAFSDLRRSVPGNWEYCSIGGVSDAPKDLEYFRSVSRMTSDCRARVLANVQRSDLKQLYGKAKIFWHAAGYGENEQRPELSEHFGISTVEAMSSGCIPIVINKGGQTEIVEHGVSGFLWDTLDALKEYTELLMRDDQMRARMGEAARARAARFSREQFVSRFLALMKDVRGFL